MFLNNYCLFNVILPINSHNPQFFFLQKKQEVGEEACSGVGQVEDVIVYKDNMKESQDYKDNLNFTQLLMGPITCDLFTGSW